MARTSRGPDHTARPCSGQGAVSGGRTTALVWFLRAPMGAAGVVPVDGAALRPTWPCLRLGAGAGTCHCFLEPLEETLSCRLTFLFLFWWSTAVDRRTLYHQFSGSSLHPLNQSCCIDRSSVDPRYVASVDLTPLTSVDAGLGLNISALNYEITRDCFQRILPGVLL
ncbi:hypothetical protein UY3_13355 [Chelonia mydas]|uniref:Uncharacterized protein n=1 Tax=Chelonia mydas TaxID=8469 RepID=M7B273_CHEMY|nr:hypothetical protein UY3_13355 [Chelonia mydas]